METTTSLIHHLKNNPKLPALGNITFTQGEQFSWQPKVKTITYNPNTASVNELLLHECGHATLGHNDQPHGINLIDRERDAWDEAKRIATYTDTTIQDETVDEALDSYRDWLHARSLCPSCGATGVQNSQKPEFSCLACGHIWRVNDGRMCALRRYPMEP